MTSKYQERKRTPFEHSIVKLFLFICWLVCSFCGFLRVCDCPIILAIVSKFDPGIWPLLLARTPLSDRWTIHLAAF